eukprot:g6086.t1
MDDVIEASEDGGFDIPTTSVAPPSCLKNLRSKEDTSQPKPRRIRIELEDDDDEGHVEGRNNGDRNPGSSTPTTPTSEGRSEKEVGSPTADKPHYRIYKLETPNEDPMLEIVVSLCPGSTAAPMSTAAATAKANPLGAAGAPQAPSCPSVSVSSDGARIVVETSPEAKGGDDDKDGVGGVRGQFTLSLPQKVVARTAMSFFWEGDLTVRAALTGME